MATKKIDVSIKDSRLACENIESITVINLNSTTTQPKFFQKFEVENPCKIVLEITPKELDATSEVSLMIVFRVKGVIDPIIKTVMNESLREESLIELVISVFQEDEIKILEKGIVIDAADFLNKSREDKAIPVSLQPASKHSDYYDVLWRVVKERTKAIGFDAYHHYMNSIFCPETKSEVRKNLPLNCDLDNIQLSNSNVYEAVELSTECFLEKECGFVDEDSNVADAFLKNLPSREKIEEKWSNKAQELKDAYLLNMMNEKIKQSLPLPYLQLIRDRLSELPLKSGLTLGFTIKPEDKAQESCYGISATRAACPTMIELIWSYWMEESLLVQTMNAITRRFQNVRASVRDPLARMDIDPLRPMSSLLWGYIQDEPARLSLVRRAYEYDHHYGFSLAGKAVPKIKTADSRSRFLGAFHQLLNLAHRFFHAYDDTTIKADAFPLLNALREVHLILAEGAHNQYGDLPWVARKEMLMMQWMLARPEMREFIGGRIMVPQKERWMDRVDGMKRLQGWSGTATTHFVDLAQTGERLLLSIRFASWSQIDKSEVALSWAVFWRDDIQRYAHAYRAVTGVDLTDPVTQAALDAKPPSYWLLQREAS